MLSTHFESLFEAVADLINVRLHLLNAQADQIMTLHVQLHEGVKLYF